jgi:predicted tellurium resistance membrane protein TerC
VDRAVPRADLPGGHPGLHCLVHTHDRTNLHDRRVRLLLARLDCPCGLFLLVKGTREIHEGIEGEAEDEGGSPVVQSLTAAINQMAVIDLVFSVDFIITAVGMAKHVGVMIGAVMVAIIVMYFASGPVAAFIERHPTTKMLALSFLLLIGAALVADAFHFHIPRGYIYFAMAFSAGVEVVNLLAQRRRRVESKKRARAGRSARVKQGQEKWHVCATLSCNALGLAQH